MIEERGVALEVIVSVYKIWLNSVHPFSRY